MWGGGASLSSALMKPSCSLSCHTFKASWSWPPSCSRPPHCYLSPCWGINVMPPPQHLNYVCHTILYQSESLGASSLTLCRQSANCDMSLVCYMSHVRSLSDTWSILCNASPPSLCRHLTVKCQTVFTIPTRLASQRKATVECYDVWCALHMQLNPSLPHSCTHFQSSVEYAFSLFLQDVRFLSIVNYFIFMTLVPFRKKSKEENSLQLKIDRT